MVTEPAANTHRLDESIADSMASAPKADFPRPSEHSGLLSMAELKNLFRIIKQNIKYFSDVQLNALTATGWRLLFLWGAARGGKTFTASMIALIFIYSWITHNLIKPGTEIWLVGNQYRNTVEEYNNLKAWLTALDWVGSSSTNEKGAEIKLKRCPACPEKTKCGHPPVKIMTMSTAYSLDNIASTAPALILVCEAAQVSEDAFHRLIIRTSQLRAPMIVSGTVDRVGGWYKAVLMRLQSKAEQQRLKARAFGFAMMDNKYVFPEGDKDPEKKFLESWLPQEEIDNKVLGILGSPTHYVFGKEFDPTIHIADVQFDPGREVWLGIDPGYSSAYAVVCCQFVRDGDYEQCRVFDEVFLQNTFNIHVIGELRRRWWYVQAQNIIAVADPAAKQHHAAASEKEVWRDETGLILKTPKKSSPRDQISYLRQFLTENPVTRQSRILINPKCRGLLSEFGYCENPNTRRMGVYSYRLEENQQVTDDDPIDADNHAVKALTYMLITARARGKLEKKTRKSVGYKRFGDMAQTYSGAGGRQW